MPATEVVALITGIIDCGTSLAAVLVPHLGPPLRTYLRKQLSYLEDPQGQLAKFHDKVTGLQRQLEGPYTADHYENVEIAEIVENADSFPSEDLSCLFGYLPNCFKRYRFGRNIEELTLRLNKLENNFQDLHRRWSPHEPDVWGDFVIRQRFETFSEIRKSILGFEGFLIGVCGATGIGKTNLVRKVCDSIKVSFGTIIWVEASHEADLKLLQRKLASKIGLSLSSDDTVLENSALLMSSLRDKKRFVLVLDNLWKAFSLEEIGIPVDPFSTRHRIILISRSSSVCHQMKSQKIFALNLFSDEEAYNLLKYEVGSHNVSTLSDETRSILKNIAKECGGLPLAIIMVARHLRKLNWNDRVIIEKALNNQLAAFRESTTDFKYIGDEVFENFVLSYDHLKNSNYSCTQECFLYCTLYPRNTAIVAKELMEYWLWEGLLGRVEQIDKMLEKAAEILDELKNAGLLDSIGHENGVEIVKLHPFIWDMAVQITRRNPRFFVKAGCRLRKPLYIDCPEDVERISFMRNDINEFRSGPNFCKLSALLLQNNPIDHRIHNAFFNSFPNLKLLDLSNTGIRILPESLFGSKNLTALLLRNCWALTILPSLSELVALLVLDISGSPISQLPSGMSSELMRLDLSGTRVRNFPRSLLTKLCNLQELLMIGCDSPWVSRSRMQDDSAAGIEDVRELEHLSVLEITFSEMQIFQDYISSEHWCQLKSFKFCVGGLYNGKLGNKSLAFIREYPSDPILLPGDALELFVMHCGDVTHLTIPRCRHLKIMDVSYCARLKYLFKVEDLQHLQNLEEIVIAQCPDLEKVIEQEDEGRNPAAETMILPSLRKLTLFNLPQLRLISDTEIKCDSLQTIAVWNCRELQVFPVLLEIKRYETNLQTPRNLKEVGGERSWFENLEEGRPHVLAILRDLFVEKSPPEELISRGRMMVPAEGQRLADNSGVQRRRVHSFTCTQS